MDWTTRGTRTRARSYRWTAIKKDWTTDSYEEDWTMDSIRDRLDEGQQ
jgi:hypothetical protein